MRPWQLALDPALGNVFVAAINNENHPPYALEMPRKDLPPDTDLPSPRNSGAPGFVGIWSINDNGDVPPRWRIPVQQLTGYVASGIALDPAHKEVILSAAGQRVRPTRGIMNTVITFSWPEIF